MRIYRDLAQWYPLITRPAEYGGEAEYITALIHEICDGPANALLELGSGSGAMASHLKNQFHCTLSDLSGEMLGLSRALNPQCEHFQGNMRTLRLGRRFDAVLIHDAIGYLTSEGDLRAAIHTAAAHLRPGGVGLFVPDDIKETFEAGTEEGGYDAEDGRSLRYLEWSYDPDPADTTFEVHFALLMAEPGQKMRCEHDSHRLGLFDRSTWRRILEDSGFEIVDSAIADPYQGQHTVFAARRPAG